MRRRLQHLLVATSAMFAGLAMAQAQSQQTQPPAAGQPGLRQTTIHQGEYKLAPDPNAFKRPRRDVPLKDGDLARGSINIAAAWFSEPTGRYRHSPFGTDQHPTALTISTTTKQVMRFRLPKDSVFEDRTPRLIDIDGDGQEEIVTIRTYERSGAALAVLGIRGKELEIIAETPPIGTPFRWLNPIGFADFNGDGKIDIAIVVTPHIRGELQIWTLRDGKLEMIADADDVSNHVFGSRHLKLSAIADFNGDGRPDIVLPSQDRRRLRFLTFTRGAIEEIAEMRLPAPAAEDFEVVSIDGRPGVKIGLAGGRTFVVSPCRDIQDWEQADGSC
jgi:hypothetical protein